MREKSSTPLIPGVGGVPFLGSGKSAGLGRLPHIRDLALSSLRQKSPGSPRPSRVASCPDFFFFISNEDGTTLRMANGKVRAFHTLLLLYHINKNTNGCYLLSIYFVPGTALDDVLIYSS